MLHVLHDHRPHRIYKIDRRYREGKAYLKYLVNYARGIDTFTYTSDPEEATQFVAGSTEYFALLRKYGIGFIKTRFVSTKQE